MSPRHKHSIRSIYWEVACPEQVQSNFAPDQISDFCRFIFFPALEKYMDENWPTTQSVEVPQISLSLELDAFESLDHGQAKKLLSELETQLKDLRIYPIQEAYSQREDQHKKLPKDVNLEHESNRSLPAGNTQVVKAFAYFLKKGRIPWWYGGTWKELSKRVRSEAIDQKQVRERCFEEPSFDVWDRILFQLSAEWKQDVLHVLAAPQMAWAEAFSKFLSRSTSIEKKEALIKRWKTHIQTLQVWSFFSVYEGNIRKANEKVWIVIWSWLLDKMHVAERKVWVSWISQDQGELSASMRSAANSLVDALQKDAKKEEQTSLERREERERVEADEEDAHTLQEQQDLDMEWTPFQPEQDVIHTFGKTITLEKEWEEGIFLGAAGLVLLNPYLQYFFEAVHLFEGKDFKDIDTRTSGVHLLHYLAEGTLNPSEDLLAIPKLLCHWPMEEPIVRDWKLHPEQLAECETLLQAVIQNWGLGSNMNPDGLRENFLRRKGKLQKFPTYWELWVEQETVDILLNKLPWGLTPIYLPWLPEPINVHWT
ncbi:MAG: contractile injection system tape measure protein [Bacteroidota bacterium]